MNIVDMNDLVAHELMRQRIEGARQSRLAVLASCCRPGTWRRAAGRARDLVGARVRRPAPSIVCCT